jgi:tRNA (Thr-GGU) A37 N-methylase
MEGSTAAWDLWLLVQGLEAIDGTPIIGIKPVIECSGDS